jgi:nicotinamide mononucleotide transporter
MNYLVEFFNINNILFTAFGYQMSYLEFVGTVLTFLSVYLAMKNSLLNWPAAIFSGILFGILFFQIQLYSDFFEQIYYIITSIYGWWLWMRIKKKTESEEVVFYSSIKTRFIYLIIIIIGSIGVGYFMKNINVFLPTLFSAPASFPYLDAFTTIMSFVAQILLAQKRVESWYIWILVDIIGIWLYFVKGVVFISFLYIIFLVLATKGLLTWKQLAAKIANVENETV